MKSETDTIIAELLILADAFKGHNQMVVQCLGGAAGRLEELQRAKAELTESIRKRDKTVADLIKQRDDAIAGARQDPSRLEIAALMLAALASRESGTWESNEESIWAVEQADTLIAAAKEVK